MPHRHANNSATEVPLFQEILICVKLKETSEHNLGGKHKKKA